MSYQRYLFIACLLILMKPSPGFAQERKDTSNFYFKLEKKADKHKLTHWIYHVIFENINEDGKDTVEKKVTITRKTVNPFLKFKGQIVRNVSIIVLDPFGYNVNDFYGKRPDYIEYVGNKYHVTTKERVIGNLLLFKTGNELDPLELSESERLLRLSPYIYDARIFVQKYKEKKGDSVDVMVVVQDKWSTMAGSRFDLNSPDINLTEKNFLGIGHQLQEDVMWSNTDQYVATSGRYSVFNIRKTFISAAAFYSTAKENKQFGVSFDRPFYSPLAKWAGGMSLIKNNTVYQQTTPETGIINKYPLNYNTFVLCGAKCFPLTQNKAAAIDKRIDKFVIGARYYRSN